MTERAVIIGNAVRFIFEGTALDTPDTAASADNVPENSDDAWLSFPCVDKASVQIEEEMKEVWCPQPGARQLSDIIPTKRKQTWKLTLNEVSQLTFQIALGHDAPDGSTDSFQPNKGTSRKGWIEIKQYDHDNDLWVTHTLWGLLRCTGEVNFDENHVQIPIEFIVIHSTNNLTEMVD